ncbi:glycosyltransferase family 4 protein [candidate division CSSED10-310 bacterium]|uniref:Glycosyltransferase family 4 protein n=1 Tax=candidate division CSSED10-310 bacterium TaxID=2855610 RepID=A0ABV6YUT5_UNCC1
MKVALVHQRWSTRGGAEKYMVHLVSELLKRGHSIELIVHRVELAVPDGVTVHHVPMFRYPLWLRLLSFAFFSQSFLTHCQYDVSFGFGKVWGPDVVRMSGGCHRAYQERIAFARAGKLAPEKQTTSLKHAFSPFHIVNRFIEDKLFQEANHIIAVSHLVQQDILRFYQGASTIQVIHNGKNPNVIDEEKTIAARRKIEQELQVPERATILLFIATNPLLKGLEYLLQAFSSFDQAFRSDFKPVLVTIGASKTSSITNLVKKYHLVQSVRNVNFVSDMELYYRGADLLIHPTLYDAFANVCLEAMSYGLPVLTSTLNGGAEIYTSGVDGLIIEQPWNKELLARLIMEAISGSKLKEIGQRGHELLKRYTFQQNVDRVEKLLLKVAAEKGLTGG